MIKKWYKLYKNWYKSKSTQIIQILRIIQIIKKNDHNLKLFKYNFVAYMIFGT